MYCSRCGASLLDGSTFCAACGTSTGILPPPPAANPPLGAQTPATPVAGTPLAAYPPGGAMAMPPVATPMVYAPQVPYAGFWLRAVAYLLDVILVSVVTVPIVIALVVATGLPEWAKTMSDENSQDPAAFIPLFTFIALLVVIMLCGLWLYYSLTESSVWQGTVGKKAMGLMVTDLDGRRVSFGRATGRFFSRLITGLVPLLIGYILAGITAKKQALHDMIAGTLVLRRQ